MPSADCHCAAHRAQVIASSGDPRLGGDDWDRTIARWLEDLFLKEHATPLDGFGRRRLLDAAEEAKIALSTQQSVVIDVPFLAGSAGLTNVTLSRRKFEALCRPLLLRLVAPVREAASMANIALDESRMGTLAKGENRNAPPRVQQWRKQVAWRWRRMAQRVGADGRVASFPLGDVPISRVLLVGGATRMPCIGRFIQRMTGIRPTVGGVDPDEAVALGAAAMAGILDGRVAGQRVINPDPLQHTRPAAKVGANPSIDEYYKDEYSP